MLIYASNTSTEFISNQPLPGPIHSNGTPSGEIMRHRVPMIMNMYEFLGGKQVAFIIKQRTLHTV